MKKNVLTLFPAIDIKEEKCVRLLFGDMEKETIYNNNPLDQAISNYKDGKAGKS